MRIPWVYAAVAVACVVASNAEAQARQFTVGEVVPQGGGQFIKILQCRPPAALKEAECEVQAWDNGRASSNPFWWNAEQLAKAEQRAFVENPSLKRNAPAPTPQAPPRASPKPNAPNPAPAPAATADCPRTPYGGPVSGNVAPSEDLFKRKVADSYTMRTRDPYWYGVTFESFTVGSPIKNTVSQQPGVGAVRVNNGAPPNATMYPVTSRHIVCEGAPTSAQRRRVQSKYLCFVRTTSGPAAVTECRRSQRCRELGGSSLRRPGRSALPMDSVHASPSPQNMRSAPYPSPVSPGGAHGTWWRFGPTQLAGC